MVITETLKNKNQQVEHQTTLIKDIDPTESLYGCYATRTADGGIQLQITDEDEFGNQGIKTIVLQKTDLTALKTMGLI